MYDILSPHMGRPMFMIMLEKSYFNRDQGSGQDFSGSDYPVGGYGHYKLSVSQMTMFLGVVKH